MSVFKVGEQARNVCRPEHASPNSAHYIGQVVTVLSPLQFVCGLSSAAHMVVANDGGKFWAMPEVLEKLPPPREDLTRTAWANVPYFSRITAPKRQEVSA